VGRRESLVHVEMTHIKTGFSSPGYPQHTVSIGLVIEAKAAGIMNRFYKLIDLTIIYPRVFRIGDEDGRCTFRYCLLKGFPDRVLLSLRWDKGL